MAYKKELTTHCNGCGVKWLDDLSNKYPRRALCYECKEKWYQEYQSKMRQKYREEAGISKNVKKEPYKFKNRKLFWDEIRTELRGMKHRSEWLPFIQNRLTEILNDKQLMDYLNDTENAEYEK